MTVFPPGVDLSFKQLVNALLYKCKYAKHQLSDLTEPELDGLDRKLHIAASAIRGFRNATQKINQLPPELIFNILGYAQQSYSYLPLASFLPDLNAYEDHGREWYSLLHVCRLWRGIIARSPELWSTVDNTIIDEEEDKNNVAHDRYLVRSRATPLTVYVGVRDKKIRKKSLETLLKHVARFKEFHLVADLWEEDPFHTPIYSLLSSAAPNLLSLTLRTDGKDVLGGVLPSVFDGDMPQLREVTLEHFTSWPPSYFHNLTALSLSDQAFNRPTTLAFLDFLENSSHTLEILALVRAGPTLSWNTDVLPASADRLVRFPKMRQKQIFSSGVQYSRTLIQT
ncbi:hypothetical protein BDP27DRAFT_315320 [Rhodocollybia butyracea]|uniref:F-box domain-containing protein n=1 Tax=Rhodocollybia butyracea TaxID=206335 RepID=A0A9P5Q304_9AGAR|nr:hypothetical protein BDP27DRAFT_315320 [Rhodocollybia butyracea]